MALSLMSNGGGGSFWQAKSKTRYFSIELEGRGVIKYPPAPLYAYVTRFQTHTNFCI